MRKILIDSHIINMVDKYADRLEGTADFGTGCRPWERLIKLESLLRKRSTKIDVLISPKQGKIPARYAHHNGSNYPSVADYVKSISDHYIGLNSLKPSEYRAKASSIFEPILANVHVEDISIKPRGGKRRPLFEYIVDAMRYDKVQGAIMGEYVRQLGIRSCVYCNAQFATTTVLTKMEQTKKGTFRVKNEPASCYELDHNLPKSKYPYLCTNFYNLLPCCSSCNKRKLDGSLPFKLYWEASDGTSYRPLHFSLAPHDVVEYRLNNKYKDIKAYLCNEGTDMPPILGDNSAADVFDRRLGIQDLYNEHTDQVEELLWMHKIYSKGLWDTLDRQLPELGISKIDRKRLLLDTYTENKDCFKRPFAIMKNDLWEQLERK